MQLPRLRQLSVAADRRVDAPQVRQGRGVGQPVEHLADAGPGLVSLLLVAPVARRQGVLEPVRYRARLYGQLQVEVFPLVDELLGVHPHLLHEVSEEAAEEEGEEGTGQVKSLVAVVIPVVQLPSAQRGEEQPVHHVPQEVGLPRLAELGDTDVGQHLLLQNFLGVLDPLLLGDSGPGAPGTDEIQGDVLLLNDKGLVEGGLHHLHQLGVVEVVDDVLEDVSVGHETQRPEHDHDGNLLLDVGEDRHDPLADRALLYVVASLGQHVDPQRARRSGGVLEARPDLGLVRVLGVFHGEHVDGVGGHLLLRDENLLGPVDDEVAARIQRALVQLRQISVSHATEETVRGAQHDGDLANEGLGVLSLDGFLSVFGHGLEDVDVEGRRISEVPQPRFVGHHGRRCAVLLPVSRFGEVDLHGKYIQFVSVPYESSS